MKSLYRLVKRGRIFYAHDRDTGKRVSLETEDLEEARCILVFKNQAAAQPKLNKSLARLFQSATDAKAGSRTWQVAMDAYVKKGKKASSGDRSTRAFKSPHFDPLRSLLITDTTAEDLMDIFTNSGSSTHNYLKRLHNLAMRKNWLVEPLIKPEDWPESPTKPTRAITEEEHLRIIDAENNREQRLYYKLLWEIGSAQSDCANLERKNFHDDVQVLVYRRQKTDKKCQLSIGASLKKLLKEFPLSGPLFPRIREIEVKNRSSEFKRRCRLLKITGITLHSYRYAWAERAFLAGYPERFAKEALGHKSTAVHRAYADNADLICPPLEAYQSELKSKLGAKISPGKP